MLSRKALTFLLRKKLSRSQIVLSNTKAKIPDASSGKTMRPKNTEKNLSRKVISQRAWMQQAKPSTNMVPLIL